MRFTRRGGLWVLAGVTAAGVATIFGETATAVTAADEMPAAGAELHPAEDLSADSDAGDDARSDAPPPIASPAPEIALAGGVLCSIPSIVEATTRWRYGRARVDASIDETTSHVTVRGSASGCDGLKMDLSIDLLIPALRVGSYRLTPSSGSPTRTPYLFANLWARTDRASPTPEIEWDTRARGASPASLTLTITSLAESSHTSERSGRDGTVTLATTRFDIHGSIAAGLPCAHAVPARRTNCRTETLLGSF